MVWNLADNKKGDRPNSVCTACRALIYSAAGQDYNWTSSPNFNPLEWACLYRVVIVYNNNTPAADSPQPQKTYKLSGVAVMDDLIGDVFEVPLDRNTRRRRFRQSDVYYGYRPFKDTLFIPPADLVSRRNDQRPVYGFPVHANCWTLIERVIGPRAEQHLDILLAAMLDAWGKIPNALCTSIQHNPLQIPAVTSLLRKLIRRSAVNNKSPSPKLKPKCLVPAMLPLEIMYMIFDCLDQANFELVLEATGWVINEEYYRCRFRCHYLVFETEKLRSQVDLDLDWPFFYREAEGLLQESGGFQTRCRIMGLLNVTKRRFLSRLASEPENTFVWILLLYGIFAIHAE